MHLQEPWIGKLRKSQSEHKVFCMILDVITDMTVVRAARMMIRHRLSRCRSGLHGVTLKRERWMQASERQHMRLACCNTLLSDITTAARRIGRALLKSGWVCRAIASCMQCLASSCHGRRLCGSRRSHPSSICSSRFAR